MGNEIITKSDSRIIAARSQTQNAFEAVGIIRDSHHPVLAGICFLDDKEVAERLKVTRRTVQNYRDRGILSYYMICGKCLYPEHEIQQMLDDNFHPAYYDSTFEERQRSKNTLLSLFHLAVDYFVFLGRPRLGWGGRSNVVGFSGNGLMSTFRLSNLSLMRPISSDTV